MKGYVCLFINEEPEFEDKISVNLGVLEDCSYCIDLYIKDNRKYLDAISDRDELSKLEETLDFSMKIATEDSERAFYENIRGFAGTKEFFDNCSKYYFCGRHEDIGKFLDNNYEFFKDKEIILSECIGLDENTLIGLKKYFANFPNIKLQVNGNVDFVSIKDYELTIDAINQIVLKIQKYDYSTFEQLIYTYDLIRDRFYVKENSDDKATISRDLTSSILGDKIVCLGFANIFKAVCDKLRIDNIVFCLAGKDSGHARNLVHLIDDKYGIDGLYFFDPTFDCKKDEENSFLFSYKYFAKTFREMDDFSNGKYTPITYKYFDTNMIEDLDYSTSRDEIDMLKTLKLLTNTRVNGMLELLGREKINPMGYVDIDEFFEILYEVSDSCNQQINSNQFIKALYRVRKQQYYEAPTKYLFDIDVLTCILINSQFVVGGQTAVDRLFEDLGLRRKYTVFTGREKVEEFLTKNNLDVDMERVKLTRTLRTIYEQKVEEEKKLEKKMF